jgi:hypothetical protein
MCAGVEPADQPDPAGHRARDAGRVADDLLLSYREQFNIGRRSLLDVLDAQNTRYNVQAQAETARWPSSMRNIACWRRATG